MRFLPEYTYYTHMRVLSVNLTHAHCTCKRFLLVYNYMCKQTAI